MCIDLVGTYTVNDQKGNDRILNVIIFLDPSTGWFEIVAEKADKTSTIISQIFHKTYLSCYPRPRKVIVDNENEFK